MDDILNRAMPLSQMLTMVHNASQKIEQCRKPPVIVFGWEEREVISIKRNDHYVNNIDIVTRPLNPTLQRGNKYSDHQMTHKFSTIRQPELIFWICKAIDIEHDRQSMPDHYQEAFDIWNNCDLTEVVVIQYYDQEWFVSFLDEIQIILTEWPSGSGARELTFQKHEDEYAELIQIILKTGSRKIE